MTDQEKKIAIAEFCGWKWQEGEEPVIGGRYKSTGWFRPDGTFVTGIWKRKEYGLPDFLNDQNAIIKATKKLNMDQQCQFIDLLEQSLRIEENIAFGDKPDKKFPLNHFGRFDVCNAEARLRADILLKVISKN